MILSSVLFSEDDIELTSECLGTGAYGAVVKGMVKSTRQEVAVKKLKKDVIDSTKQFIRELLVPLTLKLPGIVGLVGFRFPQSSSDGRAVRKEAWIVSELMKNGSLESQLKDPVPEFGPTQISKVIFGVAVTMSQMHQMKIVHRDLKPGNVLLDGNFEPRLCDFGCSRAMDVNDTSKSVGTPLFMAPEVFNESAPSTFPADVYAYGVMLWQIFWGSAPIEFEDGVILNRVGMVLIRVEKGVRFKKPDKVPDCIWELIKKCWAGGADSRPKFCDIVRDMQNDKRYVVEGTNMAQYEEYQRRIIQKTKEANTVEFNAMRGDMDDGVSIVDLVDDNDHVRERICDSIRRAVVADPNDQAYRPYDFLNDPV
jgi:serine/threonine-protein kinase